MILQFTGLSGAGKTSIAEKLKELLESEGFPAEVIDGDRYRQTICKGLGFSREDRCENIRRLGVVAESFSRQSRIAIISAINPYEEVRRELKEMYDAKVVWIYCDINILLERDTKGLYKRAMLPDDHPDKLTNLTGVNDTYETPLEPDLVVNTGEETLEASASKVMDFVMSCIKQ
jgi:adenylylsulfate kinase